MSSPSDLVLAAVLCSRNAHKARELEALLPGWTLEPLDRDDYPPETGDTYYDNALIKARFGREHADGWVLAEDSGLSVDALGGRPGVYSARYAPEGAPAIAKLLGELEGVEERRAHYVSELVLLAPGRPRAARHRSPTGPDRERAAAAARASATTRSSFRTARSGRLRNWGMSGRRSTPTELRRLVRF